MTFRCLVTSLPQDGLACLNDAVHVHVGLCLSLLRCACLCYTVPKSSVVLALVFASAVEEPNIDPDFPSFIANPFSSSILVLLLSHTSKG